MGKPKDPLAPSHSPANLSQHWKSAATYPFGPKALFLKSPITTHLCYLEGNNLLYILESHLLSSQLFLTGESGRGSEALYFEMKMDMVPGFLEYAAE